MSFSVCWGTLPCVLLLIVPRARRSACRRRLIRIIVARTRWLGLGRGRRLDGRGDVLVRLLWRWRLELAPSQGCCCDCCVRRLIWREGPSRGQRTREAVGDSWDDARSRASRLPLRRGDTIGVSRRHGEGCVRAAQASSSGSRTIPGNAGMSGLLERPEREG